MPNLAGVLMLQASSQTPEELCARMARVIDVPNVNLTTAQHVDHRFACINMVRPSIQRRPAVGNHCGVVLLVDGMVTNEDKLRSLLTGRGISISPAASIPEVCAAVFVEFGDSTGSFVEGQFNLVVWEATAGRLTIINDRFGYRPLFYARTNDRFVIAAEKKAIFAAIPETRRFSHLGLGELVAFGHNLGTATAFEAIQVLPPGVVATMDVQSADLTVRRAWQPKYSPDSTLSLDDSANELSRRLISATTSYARLGDSLGIFLSGGLDSRAVAASLGKAGRRVSAFSFGSHDHPDVEFGGEVAAGLGYQHQTFPDTPNGYMAALPRVVWRTECSLPFHNCTSIENHQHVAPLADLVFNGHFGDVLTGGHLLPQMLVLRSRKALADLIIRKRSWVHGTGFALALQPSFSRTLLEHIRNNVHHTLSTIDDGGIPQAYNVWDMTVRQARFTFSSPIIDRYLFEQASPFVSNEVVNWALTMPLPHLFLQRAYLRAILLLAPNLAQVPWARTGHPLPRHLFARILGEFERRIARRFSTNSRPPRAAVQPRLASPELLSILERWCQSDTFVPDVFETGGIREIAKRYVAGDTKLENTVATLLTIATSAQLFLEGDILQPPPAVQPVLGSNGLG